MNSRLSKVFAAVVFLGLTAATARGQVSTGASHEQELEQRITQLADQLSKQQAQIDAMQKTQMQLLEELRASRVQSANTAPAASQPSPGQPDVAAAQSANPSAAVTEQSSASNQAAGAPQSTAAPNDPRVAMATKANGGDLSGLGNLLRTDHLTIGGYGDFQFRTSPINERNDGGGTPTFQNTRFVLGIAAVLAQKQNIVFNSEIEYEFGAKEIDLEQAFVEWKMRPQFGFRGGIFVPSIGRFNTYHDSNLNMLTLRPLINQFIVPTAYRDSGIGVRGRISLPREMKLTYEVDVVNGMQSQDADGIPTPFSRIVGQSSAAEPGLIGFQASNRRKALAGRIGFSPVIGLEVGASGYNGEFNKLGNPKQSVTIFFLDGSYQRGALAINGEYGRSNIVGNGILRQSAAPPVLDPNDPSSVSALAQFVSQLSPGQDGFYVEGEYKFHPYSFADKFDEGAYIAPVFRYEAVRLDRTLPDFYLNRSRATVGVNLSPSLGFILKLNYAFNHLFAPVPRVAGPIGGADFAVNPLPYRDYGHSGFVGSIAYSF